jgi:hypothetical protein
VALLLVYNLEEIFKLLLLKEVKYKISVISDMRICWSLKVWTLEQAQLLAMFQEAGYDPEGLWHLLLVDLFNIKLTVVDSNVLDPDSLKQMEEIKAMIAQLSGRPPEAGPRPDSGVDFESVNYGVQSPEELIENIAMNEYNNQM